MGAIDPHDLLKLQAEVEAGVSLEEAAVSLGLVSPDDPLQERALVDLRHELHLFTAPDFDVTVDPERFRDPDTGRFSHGEVAYFLLQLHRFASYEDTHEVLVYDPRSGVYRPAVPVVGGIVERILREKTSGHFVVEVLGHMERKTYRSRSEFDAQLGLVVANGVLDPLTGSLVEWDSARLDTVRLPVRFVPGADCPRFRRFVEEVTPEHVLMVQEMMGYCLLKAYPIHRAFLLVGDGANGKSTLLNVLKVLLGPANVSSVPLQRLARDNFATAQLTGKLANLAADIPSAALKDTGAFKALTGGDLVYAERKFQQPFEFTSYAKLVFSANRVPLSEDESSAFYRRMTILSFPNTFSGERANKDLLASLTTEEELSGVLNWAVEGLQRLLLQGDVSDAPTVEEARRDYVRRSDPVAAFVEDRVLVDPEEEIPKDDLYEAYVNHVRGQGLLAVLNSVFAKDLKRVIPSVRDARRKRGGTRVQVWRGVRLQPEEE